MPRQEFIQQLVELGFDPDETSIGKVTFPFEVPVGRLAGQKITLGFMVAEDFPLTPPSGPHISPRLLPINPVAGTHPYHGVHESPDFGSDWEYWSRPYQEWAQTDRRVRTYMGHIRRLFDTL